MRFAAAVAEVALCGIIGAAGFGMIATGVRSWRCGDAEASDVAMSCVGAFVLGLAAWHWRRG